MYVTWFALSKWSQIKKLYTSCNKLSGFILVTFFDEPLTNWYFFYLYPAILKMTKIFIIVELLLEPDQEEDQGLDQEQDQGLDRGGDRGLDH